MHSASPVLVAKPLHNRAAPGFTFDELREFTSIPRHHHDVVVMRGLVVVYETDSLCRGPLQEGALYVRETQRAPAAMPWDSWLALEWKDRDGGERPVSPLQVCREVVQAVRWPRSDSWALRLSSGFIDGPYEEWAFGRDLIGKVVGVYQPN